MKTGNNRGQVLVILALGILALLGVAALAIDVGFLYTVRNELQRSADAGALAGASYFKETGYRITSYNVCYTKLLRRLR